ncbi:MAG: hypothetical protein H7A23_14865 [Leptospiraceae bacterium]|nr:hypothetical protein [Leptospiraceae bacterium]MCP5495832.1 hypothetical protein [Leptospiraceae bacterium]
MKKIYHLFHFINWMLILPKKFENHFEQKLKDYEEKKDMPYVSLLEKKFMSSTV